MLGRLVLLNFATQLLTDLVAVKIVDRAGYRVPLVVAHVASVAGLAMLSVLPSVTSTPYLGLALAIVTYAIGGGILEVLVSPLVDALPSPTERKAAAMSLLHSFYCWGQVAVVVGTTLLLARIGESAWQILPVVWAMVPLANLMMFLRVPLPPMVPEEHRTALGTLVGARGFVAALLLMVCAGATELTMSQWSSLFAERGLGMTKVWGDLAGPCLFAVLMGLGRFAYGLWGERVPLAPVMTASGALAIACYLVAAMARSPALALVACATCGLAVSLLWPGTFSLTARRFPLGGGAMFAVLAMCGDLGAAVGPWLAGIVADLSAARLRAGLLAGTIFPLAIVGTMVGAGLRSRARPAG